jgi:hypothetical protein
MGSSIANVIAWILCSFEASEVELASPPVPPVWREQIAEIPEDYLRKICQNTVVHHFMVEHDRA